MLNWQRTFAGGMSEKSWEICKSVPCGMLPICYFLLLSLNRKGYVVRWYKWQYNVLGVFGVFLLLLFLFLFFAFILHWDGRWVNLWRLLTWSSYLIYLCLTGDLSSYVSYSDNCNILIFLESDPKFPISIQCLLNPSS